jgi:hypothetical protein
MPVFFVDFEFRTPSRSLRHDRCGATRLSGLRAAQRDVIVTAASGVCGVASAFSATAQRRVYPDGGIPFDVVRQG